MINGYEYKFFRFLQKRKGKFDIPLDRCAVYGRKGVVSVVLPVFNGGDLLCASIDSVLSQSYTDFELIIVDDGSTDCTPEIVDRYAAKDKRIKVIHQPNQKLPRALNNGFQIAEGEFLTWTSADNIMHPDCLQQLADHMKKNPNDAMCFGNVRLIDKDGQPIYENTWHSRGERSGTVYLPSSTMQLNTYPENTICAAFMYRRIVPMLIGGYDTGLYTVEDYDYWMRINDYLSIKHIDGEEPIYDYRFHDNSLTAKAKQLNINKTRDSLMLMEDFREDWIIRPMCFVFDRDRMYGLDERIKEKGNFSISYKKAASLVWPQLGGSIAQITIAHGETPASPQARLTKDAICVLLRYGKLLNDDLTSFDLCIQVDPDTDSVLPGGFLAFDDDVALELIQVFCKAQWFDRFLGFNRSREATESDCDATIVLCTYKRVDSVRNSLAAMMAQDYSGTYEVLIINNDPENREIQKIAQAWQTDGTKGRQIRYLDCLYPGLSAARNSSLYSARGEIVLFVDDDGIMEPSCLRELISSFKEHPETSVIGGQILLNQPERFADVILPGYESIWSERRFDRNEYFNVEYDFDFPYGCNYAVRRNVLAELGGFRVSYGRMGKDFSGGEEIVLSHLVWRSGSKVGINPAAVVIHDVEASRYSLEHVRQTLRASRLTNRIMKMDMYKPYDLAMEEEKSLLNAAEERMEAFRRENVSPDDLRYKYCLYDIAATKEAIEKGKQDIRIMEVMKGVAEDDRPEPAQSGEGETFSQPDQEISQIPSRKRSFLNRLMCWLAYGFGKLFRHTKLGEKALNFESFLRENGLKASWRTYSPRYKRIAYYASLTAAQNQSIADVTREYLEDRLNESVQRAADVNRQLAERSFSLMSESLKTEREMLEQLKTLSDRQRDIEKTVMTLQLRMNSLIENLSDRMDENLMRLSDKTEQTAEDLILLSNKTTEGFSRISDNILRFSDMVEKAENSIQERVSSEARAALVPVHNAQMEAIRDLRGYVYDVEQRNIRMHDLSKINMLRQRKKILLLASAEHKNIGDAAITLGEQYLFVEQFPDYYQVEVSTYDFAAQYRFLCAIMNKDDIIIIHGGGNFGSRYKEEEEVHRLIVENFKNHKIIVMPQSLNYEDSAEGRRQLLLSQKAYDAHRNLTLFVRGKVSCSFAQEHFHFTKLAVKPDAAVCLWKKFDFTQQREGALLCLREDGESVQKTSGRQKIYNLVRRRVKKVDRSSNMSPADITRDLRAAVVEEELKRFASHKVVVTDRLHGMIFSVLTNTPVVVLKSAGEKIREYYEEFLADSNAVIFIGDDLADLEEALDKALQMEEKDCRYPSARFDAFNHFREEVGSLPEK